MNRQRRNSEDSEKKIGVQEDGALAESLIKMKAEIQDKGRVVAQLQARREMHFTDLKEKYNLNSVEEADKKIKSMDKELDQMQSALNRRIQALLERYNWDFQNETKRTW